MIEHKNGERWFDTSGEIIQAHGGGILKHGGTYYWYGEDKSAPTHSENVMLNRTPALGFRCYSSTDLLSWTDRGMVLSSDSDEPTKDLRDENVLERPKVLFNDRSGRFILWCHVDRADYSLAATGIAVSDTPTGPFRFIATLRPGGDDSRDFTVFSEGEDAWILHSSEWNKTLHLRKLSPEWTQISESPPVRIFSEKSREAPALFRHGRRWYMLTSGCTGWRPNAADLGVADSLEGPWRSLGNPCVGPESELTFGCQSTFVLPLDESQGRYLALFDRWNPDDLGDSRYVWLPFTLGEDPEELKIEWSDKPFGS